jgi:hypothetical protein
MNPAIFILPLLLACMDFAVAQSGPRTGPSGQKIAQRGKFRVFYQLEGRHAVNPMDANTNGIPDRVEDILTQTEAARTIFVDLLGFQDPLQSDRYQGAEYVDIHIRSKKAIKSNGLAFDELTRKPEGPVLRFDVANSVNAATNPTPAHEYFHLIQYGMTFFKNPWYLEGTARWSEKPFKSGGPGQLRKLASWPLSTDSASELYRRSYDASIHFWNPLAADLDKTRKLPDSPILDRLATQSYIDGSPVMRDADFTGWRFIRSLLTELGRRDDAALQELEHDTWSEANQRSPRNNPYIMRAVEKVAAEIAGVK